MKGFMKFIAWSGAAIFVIAWIGGADDRTLQRAAQVEARIDATTPTRQPRETPRAPARPEWRLQSAQSEMTDQTNVFLTVRSDTPVQCTWGGGYLTLTARCLENTTSLVISGDCHMTSSRYNDYGHVTYRTDDDQPRTWQMAAATNNQALGLWTGSAAIPQVRRLFGKSDLRVRVRPFGQNAVETTFNIEGLETLIGPLRRACNW